jgi:DNA-binding beta-propeller fold protein YncE
MALDPSGNWLYVTSQRKLLRYDLRTGVPADPLDIAFPPGVDTPLALAVSPTGGWLYVSTADAASLERFPWEGSGFVTVYDLSGGAPDHGVNVRLQQPSNWIPLWLVVDPTGTSLYILNHGIEDPNTPQHRYSNVMAFDIERGRPTHGVDLRPSALVHHPAGIALDPVGPRLYVRAEGGIVVYPTQSRATPGRRTPSVASGREIAVHPMGKHVYHASFPTSIGVSEIRDGAISATNFISLPQEVFDPGPMAVDPAGTRLYVATRRNPTIRRDGPPDGGASYLNVYDITTGAPILLTNLRLPAQVTGVASLLSNAAGSRLYVAANGRTEGDSTGLLVIDTSDGLP